MYVIPTEFSHISQSNVVKLEALYSINLPQIERESNSESSISWNSIHTYEITSNTFSGYVSDHSLDSGTEIIPHLIYQDQI